MATAKTAVPLALAERVAQDLLSWVAFACDRCDVAGSVRRRVAECGDIELVCLPKFRTIPVVPAQADLFGEHAPCGMETRNELWDALERRGVEFSKSGQKYRQFRFRGLQVDAFTADAENFGWIKLIRTGSAAFSKSVATELNRRGYSSANGRIFLVDGGRIVATPEEEDVFALAGMPWIRAEDRSW